MVRNGFSTYTKTTVIYFHLHQRERHAHGVNIIAFIRSRFKHGAKRHRDNHCMIGIFLKRGYSNSSFTWAIF